MTIFSQDVQDNNKIAYFLLLLLFVFMALLSYFLPYQRDDFLYAFVWNTSERIGSMADIVRSIHKHYLIWGGRIVPVFFMQYFQLIGKGYYAIVNGLMYTALVVLIYWHGLGRVVRCFNPWLLSIIIVGCWFALPDYGFTSIWACGTANYLWPTVLILLTLLPYHTAFTVRGEGENGHSFFKGIGLFVLALVASVTIENTVLTMCMALVCFTVYAARQHFLRMWMVMGTLGSILGTAILMAAPGNFARAATTHTYWYNNIANFLGAHMQILLGLLPVLLVIILALECLLCHKAAAMAERKIFLTKGFYIKMGFIAVFAVSSATNHFFAHALTSGIISTIIDPLGLNNPGVYSKLSYALSSTEAVLIYILACSMLYKLGKQAFQIEGVSLRQGFKVLPTSAVFAVNKLFWQRMALVFAMALIHNGAMLFSPQFPARAGFGSAVFILIIMTMLLMETKLYEDIVSKWRKAWAVILFLSFVPMAAETLSGCQTLYQENTLRERYIAEQVAAGATKLTLKKLSVETSVLRHIYFSDMDSDFAKGCALPYYGLRNVVVK